MIQIAICDDEPLELSYLSKLIYQYQEEYGQDINCIRFSSAIDLLDGMKQETFDLVLLDILMPYMNGIQVAHEIRSFDQHVKIIFLTSSSEFAVESYAIKAYHYMLKPITKASLFPLLKDAIYDLDEQHRDSLLLKYKAGITCIPFFQLEAIEISGKTLYFYLSNGSTLAIAGSLSSIEQRLLYRNEFMKSHRAFIINIKFIRTFEGKEITTFSNRRVLVSKAIYPKLKERYLQYLFTRERITQ